MRKQDFARLRELYKKHNIEINIQEIENCIKNRAEYISKDNKGLINYPKVSHVDALANEKFSAMLKDVINDQDIGEGNTKRISEWKSTIKGVKDVMAAILNLNNIIIAQNKKTIIVCTRELKRGLSKTSKINPILKSKKIHKELSGELKRIERNIRETTKKEEKAKSERIKKEQEAKEEKRQKRKFEYLLSQTELFSHFILNKNKAGLTTDVKASEPTVSALKEDGEDIYEQNKGYEAAVKQAEELKNFDIPTTKKIKTDTKASTAQDHYVPQPKILNCKLKEYQIKGLNWLVNLYDKGINGILADDMGLGKTVQSISLMAYLYESEGIPGPFLVVTPASTLHNWTQELGKFVPNFKVCSYWGTTTERRELKKQFKNVNVVVTSYQTAVTDGKILKKTKWQYLILDEAQAIKSNTSQRWKILLSFKARNRLLLTGTPVQNSMQELWALLHFIMPTLFDSLAEFSDWFSKEIETSAGLNKAVDQKSLDRLHTILKPFMLRRHKSDVIHELSQKTQIDLHCDLSYRQKQLYKEIRRSCSVMEMENLVMQLKKVCNHPDLFEKLEPSCGFSFEKDDGCSNNIVNFGRSKIGIKLPSLIAEDLVETFRKKELILKEKIEIIKKFLLESCSINNYLKNSFDISNTNKPSTSFCEIGILIHKYMPMFFKNIAFTVYNNENKNDFSVSEVCDKVRKDVDLEIDRIKKVIFSSTKVLAPSPYITSNTVKLPPFTIDSNGFKTFLNKKVYVPPLDTFISDSGKLILLDQLLPKLKSEGHRILMYFQMTRMIDLMEDYLIKKGYTYLRLDGSSRISNRRDMVKDWQTNDKFIFLLSTRAGGLGINLTAADTVIFYDSDWNPTVDQQAMDRAHRLGQTRDVTVYRLITKGTVEEKVIASANRKDEIQKMVIHGNIFEGENF